jgi:RNA polymerase sigma-70 factor (ECF subfamily)
MEHLGQLCVYIDELWIQGHPMRHLEITSEPERGISPRSDKMSDETLVSMFQSGDKHVFNTLVLRYQERVRNLIHSVMGNIDIDDIGQDVFVKVYESLHKFRYESSFYTWLYKIVLNRCRDEMRRNKLRRFLSLDSAMEKDSSHPSHPPEYLEQGQLADAIEKALGALSQNHRVVVVLKDIQGLSYEEIAEVMRCGIGTVKSRLARARGHLKEILEPYMDEGVV